MKAILYDIEIVTDIIHGWKNTIREIYVSEYHMFINDKYCFICRSLKDKEERSKKIKNIVDIELDDDLVKDLFSSTIDYDKIKLQKESLQKSLWTALEKDQKTMHLKLDIADQTGLKEE